MGIFILPDAQEDLLSLQECTLDTRSESDWLKAEDEIFEKLTLVDTGFLIGAHVQELASVGISERLHLTPQAGYRRIGDDTYVYAAAGHRQDHPTLLMKRLLRI